MTSPRGHLCSGHVWHSDTLDDMAQVLQRQVNLFNCERGVPNEIAEELDRLPKPRPFSIDLSKDAPTLAAEKIGRRLSCEPSLARWFADDITELRDRFSAVSGIPSPRVLLECVRKQTCTLLHTDELSLRLLTTYLGPATVWVRNDGVVRAHLGTQNDAAVCPDTAFMRCSKRFAVLVLKGDNHPANRGKGLVHRSPQMAEDEMRLVLRIDASTHGHPLHG